MEILKVVDSSSWAYFYNPKGLVGFKLKLNF
jgi:hypothetical protein